MIKKIWRAAGGTRKEAGVTFFNFSHEYAFIYDENIDKWVKPQFEILSKDFLDVLSGNCNNFNTKNICEIEMTPEEKIKFL